MKNRSTIKSDSRSDSELLRCFVQTRDEASFELLVRRYQNLVWITCWRVLSQTHDVDDAFQATFIALARGAHKIRSIESLGVWLHNVAYRRSIEVRQAQKRRREEPMTEMMLDRPDAVEQMAQRYQQQAVDQELARLPSKYRQPLVLFYFCGRTYREIGEELQLSVAAVESRLRRGLREMRRRVKNRGVSLSVMTVAMSVCHELPAHWTGELLIHQTVNASMVANPKGWFAQLNTQITQSFLQGCQLMRLPVTQSIMIATFIALLAGWTLLATDSKLKVRALSVTIPSTDLSSHFSAPLVISSAFQEDELQLTREQRRLFETLTQRLNIEVVVLQATSDLTEQQSAAVKQAFRQVSDAAKQRLRSEENRLGPESIQRHLRETSLDLTKTLRKLAETGTISQSQLQRYERDEQLKRKLLADALKKIAAAQIEVRIASHGDQSSEILHLVDQLVDQQVSAFGMAELLNIASVEGVMAHLPQARLQQCLTPQQWNFHSACQHSVRGDLLMLTSLWSEYKNDSEATLAKVRKFFLQYHALVQHRLKRELRLSDKQTRRLEIAGKGIVDRLIERQAEHYRTMQREGYRLAEWDEKQLNLARRSLRSEAKLLNRTLERTLDEKQKAQLAKREKARSDLMSAANLKYQIIMLEWIGAELRLGITGEQLRKFCDLINERTEPHYLANEFPPSPEAMAVQLSNLTKDDLLTLFSEPQASQLSELLAEFEALRGDPEFEALVGPDELKDAQLDQRQSSLHPF